MLVCNIWQMSTGVTLYNVVSHAKCRGVLTCGVIDEVNEINAFNREELGGV